MQLRTILILSVLIFSSLAGCVEDIREEQKVEKTDDLRKMEDRIVTNESSTEISTMRPITPLNPSPILSENMTQEECEREGGIWVEVIEDRSGNTSYAMSTIRKMGGVIDNNSIEDYDNDNSSGLDWDEFVQIWNSVEDENLTNETQNYTEILTSFNELDFDSDGELSIAELVRSQDDIIINTRPSWCSFSNGEEFEITQEMCEERGGTWTEAPDRDGVSYCEFRDREDSNITQEDCERRGGTWTEAPDRDGEYYCDFNDEEDREEEETSENTPQEDCEERGGTWIEDRRECQLDENEEESDS